MTALIRNSCIRNGVLLQSGALNGFGVVGFGGDASGDVLRELLAL